MVIESGEMNSPVIDGILENLKDNPGFELLRLNQASMLSLPGLEIDTTHRKVYCGGKLAIPRFLTVSAASAQTY